jgi:hypothetical protein
LIHAHRATSRVCIADASGDEVGVVVKVERLTRTVSHLCVCVELDPGKVSLFRVVRTSTAVLKELRCCWISLTVMCWWAYPTQVAYGEGGWRFDS